MHSIKTDRTILQDSKIARALARPTGGCPWMGTHDKEDVEEAMREVFG